MYFDLTREIPHRENRRDLPIKLENLYHTAAYMEKVDEGVKGELARFFHEEAFLKMKKKMERMEESRKKSYRIISRITRISVNLRSYII